MIMVESLVEAADNSGGIFFLNALEFLADLTGNMQGWVS